MSDRAQRISEIRERLGKATPGEWSFSWPDVTDDGHYETPKIFSVADPEAPKYLAELATGRNEEENGGFIAHAPSDIRYLLDALTAKDSELASLRELMQQYDMVDSGGLDTDALKHALEDHARWSKDVVKLDVENIALKAEINPLRERLATAERERDGLRKRVHFLEGHNQIFERCESGWCHPHESDFMAATYPALTFDNHGRNYQNELQQQVATLTAALRWALGETDEFRLRESGEGAYWWRKELRQRAFGALLNKDAQNGESQ